MEWYLAKIVILEVWSDVVVVVSITSGINQFVK